MTDQDTPLRLSERLRIALISLASDDDEVTLNRPAAQALVDEVAEIERMAGQAADMVVAARDAADAWHQAGVENGGVAIEDPPGIREMQFGKLYLAYLRDPDGITIEFIEAP